MEYWSIGALRSGGIASALADLETVRATGGSKRELPGGAFFPLVVSVVRCSLHRLFGVLD